MGEDSTSPEIQPIFKELPDDPNFAESKPSLFGKLKKEFVGLPPVKLAEKMDVTSRLRNLAANPETYVMLQKGLGIALFAGAVAGVYSHDIPAQFIVKAPEIINSSMGNVSENAILSNQFKGTVDILEALGVPLVGDFSKTLESLMDSHPKAEAFFVSAKERVQEELTDFKFMRNKIGPAMQVFGVQPPAMGVQYA